MQASLDPLPNRSQIVKLDEQRRVLLDERALGGEAHPNTAHQGRRVTAHAGAQIVDEAPGGAHAVRGGVRSRVDEHAQEQQAGHPSAQFVDRLNARGVARQQFLDIAAQVRVQGRGAPGRRHGKQARQQPQPRSVTQRPHDKAPRWIVGVRAGVRHGPATISC